MVLLGLCLGVRTRYAGDFNVRWLDATVLQLELVTCRENSQKGCIHLSLRNKILSQNIVTVFKKSTVPVFTSFIFVFSRMCRVTKTTRTVHT